MLHDLGVYQIQIEMQNDELIRAQADLSAAKERYFDIYDQAPVGYCTLSDKGTILETNLTASDMFGLSRGEVVKKHFPHFIFKDDRNIYYGSFKHLLDRLPQNSGESSQPDVCAIRMLRKDNDPFWARLESTVLKDKDGSAIFRVVIIDITECKKSEKRLKDITSRYKLVMEGSQGGIWDWDVVNSRVHFSSRWKKMRGYEDDEISDSLDEWKSRIDPDDIDRVMAAVDDHFKGKTEVFNEEYRIQCKDGTWRWVIDRGKALKDADGRVLRMAGSEIDITDRKESEKKQEKLQSQLNHAQKLEAVGRLAGGVAHDFNNMLSVILGYTEITIDSMTPHDQFYDEFKEIQNAAQRSVDIVRHLLAFARKQTISPKLINLNDSIEGMIKILKRLIGEDITLNWVPANDLWNVCMDPSQVDQILANLCVNARDAIEGVGNISISTDMITLNKEWCDYQQNSFIPGDYVQLTVSDDGSGIDKEDMSNIFEPFFTTKEIGKGTGLGLSTVYGILNQNHCFIDVDSQKGRGTTFTIYIPRYKEDEESLQNSCIGIPAKEGFETILVVEDEPAILNMVKLFLEKLGYNVLASNKPSEAIEMVGKYDGAIDLLLTDVIMPE
ncbi:MAG: PAS domain-containing protein, partial [Desulfamplus sp.]|nr:PAS domain-containing protein [Desulfamplus sp.]